MSPLRENLVCVFVSLVEHVEDAELQRAGLEEEQRCERVEERLLGVGQVAALVRHQPCRQLVLQQLLHRDVGERLPHGAHRR